MEELYQENAKIVYHFLLSLCRDATLAEDLTQDTFLAAYQSLERYDGSCKLSTWLCQIARHLYYRHLAKTGREVLSEPEDTAQAFIPTERQPEEQILHRLELMDMLKEMQKLPAQTREVIYLRSTACLSFREIGQILGKSENWARTVFYRGKEALIKAARSAGWEEK